MPTSDFLRGFFGAPVAAATFLKTIQALVVVLPQTIVACLLAGRSLFRPMLWRGAVDGLQESIRTKPLKSVVMLVVLAAVLGGGWWLLSGSAEESGTSGDAATAESWPTFSGSIARRGTAPADVPTELSGRLRWQFRDALILERRPFASSPAVAGSRVVIGSDNFKLYCIDLGTGKQLWSFEARWPIFSSPVIWNGRVYVGEGLHEQSDSKFYCLDLATGKVIWEIQTQSHTESTPTVTDGRVYFGAGSEGIYCADALTGEVLWKHGNPRAGPLGNPHVDGCPLVVGDRVYFGSGYGFEGLLCLDARDGRFLWKRKMPAPVWGAPSFVDGKLYISIGNGNFMESAENPYGEVRCLDAEDGHDIWRFAAPRDGVITSVAVSGNTAVFGSRDGTLYAVDAKTGQGLWQVTVDSPVLSTPAISGDRVLFGADDGHFRCVSLHDGKRLWSYDTTEDLFITMMDARIQSSPAVTEAKVIFGAANGNVYCLGGDETSEPVVVQARHDSRIMRAADFVLMGLISWLRALTRNLGWGLLLAACILKLLLTPLNWREMWHLEKMKEVQARVADVWRKTEDYRTGRAEVQELYASQGIRPAVPLVLGLFQVLLFLLSILVIQSAPAFADQGFLWISDLSAADRVVLVSKLPVVGIPLTLLSLLFLASFWGYLLSLGGPGKRWHPGRLIGLLLIATGLGWLTYQWAAASVLFVIGILMLDVLQHALLRAFASGRSRPSHES